MTTLDFFAKLEHLNISLLIDPDWNKSLGPERWMALTNMKFDHGFMGSEWTGWIEGDGITGDVSARGATALEAYTALLEKLGVEP